MSDGPYAPTRDDADDLPRTLRRAREQQAREQSAQPDAHGWDRGRSGSPSSAYHVAANPYDTPLTAVAGPVAVNRLQVPFFSLMGFLVKAVFAGIPALLILVGLFYGLGIALQTYFPQLIKMKILITFP